MSYEVKAFKLISGEEILCKAEPHDEKSFVISDARMLMFGQGGQPQMIPYMMLSHGRDVILRKDAIMSEVKTLDPEMEKKYLSDTSGIALA